MGLDLIGQVVNDDNRVSAEPAVNMSESATPESQQQNWHFSEVHESEERLVRAESDASRERGTRFTVALMTARERVR